MVKKKVSPNLKKDAKTLFEQERFNIIFQYSPIAIWIEDFSALAQLGAKLKEQKVKNIRQYLKEHPNVVKETFRKLKILDVNKAALELYGAESKKELIKNLGKSFRRDVLAIMVDEFDALLKGEMIFEAEFKSKTLKGDLYDVALRVSVPEMYKKSLDRVIVTFLDITVQKKLERHLRRQAQTDGLTGVLNQSAIKKRLREEFVRARRYREQLSIVMIDLDLFKTINDRYGHQGGDHAIKRAAALLKRHLREVDIIGRYGGDEFLVILPETPAESGKIAAERLQKLFENLSEKKKGESIKYTTASFGIAGLKSEGVGTSEEFIKRADMALYEAKRQGRNCIVIK